jgi:hypothetical protein
MAKTPQHVAVPAFRSHLLDYDPSSAAKACQVPTAYIAAANLMADLGQFKRLCPQLLTAQTMGSGHFSLLEVPEQINAMLERFMTISVRDARTPLGEYHRIADASICQGQPPATRWQLAL